MARGDLSPEEWARLEPLLPPQHGPRGRPYLEHRTVLNGILWRLRTGAPWRDLPARYGSWQTCYSRFRRWQQQGIWQRLLEQLQRRADQEGDLAWAVVAVDSTTVRAHQHAAGARTRPPSRTSGPEKGGRGACLRSPRTQPRRADDQAASGQRRQRTAARRASDRGATPR
jgi:transposase